MHFLPQQHMNVWGGFFQCSSEIFQAVHDDKPPPLPKKKKKKILTQPALFFYLILNFFTSWKKQTNMV